MGAFEYPILLEFRSEEHHIQHVNKHISFYTAIVNEELSLKLEAERVAKEEMVLQLEYREQQLKMKNEELEKKVEQLHEKDEQVRKVELLNGKREQYALVPPTSIGLQFEDNIMYFLEKHIETYRLGDEYEVEKDGGKHKCDIRVHWEGQTIGIEAKNKKVIEKEDLGKFDRDVKENGFSGGVFWSRYRKIPRTRDNGEGGNYIEMLNDNCLYVRGEDYELIIDVIFAYMRFLGALKYNSSENTLFLEMVQQMFKMMFEHYKLFGNLKNEVMKVDKSLKNDLEVIDNLCRKHRIQGVPQFKVKNTDLYVGKRNKFYDLSHYENKVLQMDRYESGASLRPIEGSKWTSPTKKDISKLTTKDPSCSRSPDCLRATFGPTKSTPSISPINETSSLLMKENVLMSSPATTTVTDDSISSETPKKRNSNLPVSYKIPPKKSSPMSWLDLI